MLYYIWKRMYGGLRVKDPVNYPLNPKTKLAMGDLRRIAFNFGFIAFFGFLGYPWLKWFEGDWGPEYYEETYSSGFLKDFDLMLNIILVASVIFAVIAVVLYLVSRSIDPKPLKKKEAV